METFEAPERTRVRPPTGDERTQLEAWLDFQRATLLMQVRRAHRRAAEERPVATSSLSLLGIVRHMTFVEQIWFETVFAGRETVEYYKTEADRDADFNDLDSARPSKRSSTCSCARVELSRELAAGHSLDDLRPSSPWRGRTSTCAGSTST